MTTTRALSLKKQLKGVCILEIHPSTLKTGKPIKIDNIEEGCYYNLSFFAHGEGAQVGLTAKLVFETPGGDVIGGTVTVRKQDLINSNRDFAYFKMITSAAPNGVTGVRIEFSVDATGGQSLDLDDVSLTSL